MYMRHIAELRFLTEEAVNILKYPYLRPQVSPAVPNGIEPKTRDIILRNCSTLNCGVHDGAQTGTAGLDRNTA